MVTPGLIKRIARFKEAINKLKELSKYDLLAFKGDFRNVDSAERNLEVALQALIDTGNYIVTKLGLGVPTSYRDIAELLLKGGILSVDTYNLLKKMIGLRHILVHQYAEVNVEIIYDIITNKLHDLEIIMSQLLETIRKRNLDP